MRRIILSLVTLVGMASVVTIGATGAFFSDTETSTGNTFAAGAIDLLIDNESYYNGEVSTTTSWTLTDLTVEKFFDFNDLKPGDYGEDTISLHVETNDAYMCASVTLTSNEENDLIDPEEDAGDTTEDEGELAGLVNFLWWADDGDNVLEDDEDVISSGPIGALSIGEPFTIALADSDENIWTGEGGPVPGEETHYIGKAWCFGDISADPLPQDDYDSPADDNNDNQTASEPEDGGISCEGGENIGNESQTDSLTADVSFEAVQARHNPDFQCDEPPVFQACENPELAFADSVISSAQGTRKNGTPVAADRTDPNDALGAPQSTGTPFDNQVPTGEFFSLGFNVGSTTGGNIVVAFTDNIIVDGAGNDLRVWEVTGGSSYPVEKVKIEVSQDGTTWHEVISSLDRDAEADLASSGLDWAAFVRLTDVSNIAEFEATADGYDLDAFSALNCAVPLNGGQED